LSYKLFAQIWANFDQNFGPKNFLGDTDAYLTFSTSTALSSIDGKASN